MTEATPPRDPAAPTGELFHRPGWMVTGTAAAAGIGLVASGLSWFSGKGFFAILWLIVALFWLRRFLWIREAPLFEITPQALIAHLSAIRQHQLPLATVERIEQDDDRLVVHLDDGSNTVFRASDLRRGEWQRFTETLAAAHRRAGSR